MVKITPEKLFTYGEMIIEDKDGNRIKIDKTGFRPDTKDMEIVMVGDTVDIIYVYGNNSDIEATYFKIIN